MCLFECVVPVALAEVYIFEPLCLWVFSKSLSAFVELAKMWGNKQRVTHSHKLWSTKRAHPTQSHLARVNFETFFQHILSDGYPCV